MRHAPASEHRGPTSARACSPSYISVDQLQRIEAEPRFVELPRELRAPRAAGVERRVLDAVDVGRELHRLLVERAHALALQPAHREPELEDDVLPGARMERVLVGGE